MRRRFVMKTAPALSAIAQSRLDPHAIKLAAGVDRRPFGKRPLLSEVILCLAMFFLPIEAMQAAQLLSTVPARPRMTTEVIARVAIIGGSHGKGSPVTLKEIFFLALGMGAFVGGALLVGKYLEKKRSDKIEAAAVRLGFAFRRKQAEGGKALVGDCFLPNIREAQKICNVVEAVRNEDLKITLFDFVYTHRYKNGNKIMTNQTITRLESPALLLPRFTLFPESDASKLPNLSGMNDLTLPAAPEFSEEYNLRAIEEAKVRRLFTPAVIHYFQERSSLAVVADAGVVFFFGFKREMEETELTFFVEQGKEVLALFLKANRHSGPAAS